MAESGVFITGTDTGVGKTFVGKMLAASLVKRGIDVGVMKPVETGCTDMIPNDARMLKEAASSQDSLNIICPAVFRETLSPYAAATREGREVDIGGIRAAYRELSGRHKLMIIEGAGGLMVPLDRRHLIADLAIEMGFPLLIVAANRLGCINHVLLTVKAAKSMGLDILGVVLNQLDSRLDLSRRTNAEIIKELSPYRPIEISFSPYNGPLYKHPDAELLTNRILASLPPQ